MADKVATFGIKINASTNAALAAGDVDSLATALTDSAAAAKELSRAQRQLRGTTDEVKAARVTLKDAVTAERDAVSQLTIALGKEGTTYGDVLKKQKAASAQAEKTKKDQEELALKAESTRKVEERAAKKKAEQEQYFARISALNDKKASDRQTAQAKYLAGLEAVRVKRKQDLLDTEARREARRLSAQKDAELAAFGKKQQRILDRQNKSNAGGNSKTGAGAGDGKDSPFKAIASGAFAASGRIEGLGFRLSKFNALASSSYAVLGGLAAAFTLTGIAVVAVGAAIADVSIKMATFGFRNADMWRRLSLLREAATGGAANAKAWGEQIAETAKYVDLPIEKLNELSIEMHQTLGDARLSGDGIVKAFNAVAQVTSALGDQAGKNLEELFTRGKNFGNFYLGLNELRDKVGLMGPGSQREDFVKRVAQDTGKTLKEATSMLVAGRVPYEAAVNALYGIVVDKFGRINYDLRSGLSSAWRRLGENLSVLTQSIDLKPVISQLNAIVDLSSKSSYTGYSLGVVFETMGKIVNLTTGGTSGIKDFFDQLIGKVLDFEIYLLKNKGAIKEWANSLVKGATDALSTLTDIAVVFKAIADSIRFVSDVNKVVTDSSPRYKADFGIPVVNGRDIPRAPPGGPAPNAGAKPAVNINLHAPVTFTGDIKSPQDAEKMLRHDWVTSFQGILEQVNRNMGLPVQQEEATAP